MQGGDIRTRHTRAATSRPYSYHHISPAYHPSIFYISDDISQIPQNNPGYVSASDDERERLAILLHKRLDQVIDQEQQAGLSEQDRERLAATTSRSEPN